MSKYNIGDKFGFRIDNSDVQDPSDLSAPVHEYEIVSINSKPARHRYTMKSKSFIGTLQINEDEIDDLKVDPSLWNVSSTLDDLEEDALPPTRSGGVTCKICHYHNEYLDTPSEADGTHICRPCRG